jgi:hypothetical protein
MRSGIRGVGVVAAVGLMLGAVSPARGVVWSVHPTPSFGVDSGLSCVSATFCTAVGQTYEGPTPGAAAMEWDGRRWRMLRTPDPDPASEDLRAEDSLAGVSCTSSKACVAVGEYTPSTFSPDGIHTVPVTMPLAERWNGVRWSLLAVPTLPTGAGAGGLSAVSCTSGRACMAVSSSDAGTGSLFAERWDGTTWFTESMPDPGGSDAYVSGVSCTSTSFCSAVGTYLGPGSDPDQSFAERWNGSAWSLIPLPHIASPIADLSSVSCTSPSACIAVGEVSTVPFHGSFQTLAERWDGTSWSVQRTPNARGKANMLAGVSCTSSRACTAVGDTDYQQPLLERWDGRTWTRERTPRAGVTGLAVVSCTPGMICTAVGSVTRGNDVAEQSVPADARLGGIPVRCASGRFISRVTGIGISSVVWSLDSQRIPGHSVDRGTDYVASLRLSPGRHELTVEVRFTASSQTHARTFRRSVRGCSPAR